MLAYINFNDVDDNPIMNFSLHLHANHDMFYEEFNLFYFVLSNTAVMEIGSKWTLDKFKVSQSVFVALSE